jgi:putative transposase
MSNTFTQIHIQFVFAVKYRECLLHKKWNDELYKYITGIVQKQNHKMIAINGVSDHIHLLIGMRPTQSISDLMQDVKGSSSKWINEKNFVPKKFEWQEGYGAFSYSLSQVKTVVNYIKNQEAHHAKQSFRDEYISFLKEFEVPFDEVYIFKDPV